MLLKLQGLSIVFFYGEKHQVPKFLRWILVFMAFTNGFIMQAVVFAGAFDIALDFRKLRRPEPPENTNAGE